MNEHQEENSIQNPIIDTKTEHYGRMYYMSQWLVREVDHIVVSAARQR